MNKRIQAKEFAQEFSNDVLTQSQNNEDGGFSMPPDFMSTAGDG